MVLIPAYRLLILPQGASNNKQKLKYVNQLLMNNLHLYITKISLYDLNCLSYKLNIIN